MDILIIGGTGFIGSHLKEHFSNQHHRVITLGREAFLAECDLKAYLENCDVLIMLSGANIGERWTPSHKQAIWQSRIITNQKLAKALSACTNGPKRILSASAIGIYPESFCNHPLDESEQAVGDNELGRLAKAWEATSQQLDPKPVIMRFGVVLGENGGALQKVLLPFKLGLGGPIGSGEQCFSWIHIDDLTRAIGFLLEHPEIKGPVNLTAPDPVTNREFGKTLAKTLSRPFWLPLPEWFLKLVLGEGAVVLTLSSAVWPQQLTKSDFEFHYPKLDLALKKLLVDR